MFDRNYAGQKFDLAKLIMTNIRIINAVTYISQRCFKLTKMEKNVKIYDSRAQKYIFALQVSLLFLNEPATNYRV